MQFLDLPSLATLNATLNRGAQKLLSTPSLVGTVRIGNLDGKKDGALRYLLTRLSDVRCLVLDGSESLRQIHIHRLLALNPLELVSDGSYNFSDATEFNTKLLAYSNSLNEGLESKCPANQSLPWLSRLTPRLTSLIIRGTNGLPGMFMEDLFPKSLTSFQIGRHVATIALLRALPTTLLSLTITLNSRTEFFQWIRYITPRFHHLMHLTMTLAVGSDFNFKEASDLAASAPAPILSSTIQTLRIYRVASNLVFFHLLKVLSAGCTQLHTIVVEGVEPFSNDPMDVNQESTSSHHVYLDDILPSSVIHFSFFYGSRPRTIIPNCFEFVNFSQHLVSLSVMVRDDFVLLRGALATHRSLQRLKLSTLRGNGFDMTWSDLGAIEQAAPQPFLLPCTMLPPTLTHLAVDNTCALTELTIRHLPAQLVLLAVDHFDLSLHHLLVQRLPTCRLKIFLQIKLWNSANGAWLTQNTFAKFWTTPHFNADVWRSQLFAHLNMMNVSCRVDDALPSGNLEALRFSNQIESMLLTSGDKKSDDMSPYLAKLNRDCPKLTKLGVRVASEIRWQPSVSLNSLTSLDLHHSPCSFSLGNLVNLRCFSSLATYAPSYEADTEAVAPKHLTFLDVPNWSIRSEDVLTWNFNDMEKLRFKLVDIEDYKVVHFLTTRVNAKTRANMSVTLDVVVTGALILDDGTADLRHVTWKILEDNTLSQLNAALAVCVTREHAAGTEDDASTTGDTIGSVIASLQSKRVELGTSEVWIPRSASSVRLSLRKMKIESPSRLNSQLALLDSNSPTQSTCGTISNADWFGPSLTTLDLSKVSFLPTTLPPTLRHLRIETLDEKTYYAIFAKPLPSKLSTLIIEWAGTYDTFPGRPYSMLPKGAGSSFPTSLEHFALHAKYLDDCYPPSSLASQNLCFPKLNLPNIKSFSIPGISALDLQTYCLTLPLETIEQIVVSPHSQALDSDNGVDIRYKSKIIQDTEVFAHVSRLIDNMHAQ